MRALLLSIILATWSLCEAQAPTEKIVLDLASRNQQIEGWGSSLCWWASEVGNWQEQRVDSVIELITSPDQLNMNIFRFNIGGGDDPEHLGGHMVKGKGKRAEMEGYRPDPNATYDWSADAAQRNILLKIKAARPDAVFEAFSNSPPYWMTKSGCSAGYFQAGEDNLSPDRYEEFADYLISVLKHYKEAYGVDFKTLDPFNESTSSYWGYMGGQEGCHFDARSQVAFLKVLYPKLKASGLKTVISASDETSLESTLKVWETYMKSSEVFDLIGQLNTHTYSGDNQERVQIRKWVENLDKPLWQSESGPMGDEFRGVRGAFPNNLMLAQKMFNDLRIMKPQAWIDWQLIEEHNNTWCQLRADFDEERFEVIKNFYVRMQVTRFVKQGYTILGTSENEMLAALSPDEKELVLVLLNKSEQPANRSLLFKGARFKLRETYRTSASEDCEAVKRVKKKNRVMLPPQSITTLIFSR